MSSSRKCASRVFQTCPPATAKLLSQHVLCMHGTVVSVWYNFFTTMPNIFTVGCKINSRVVISNWRHVWFLNTFSRLKHMNTALYSSMLWHCWLANRKGICRVIIYAYNIFSWRFVQVGGHRPKYHVDMRSSGLAYEDARYEDDWRLRIKRAND